eukprot:1331619-Amorphochlora_amoeboformis.AAC.1
MKKTSRRIQTVCGALRRWKARRYLVGMGICEHIYPNLLLFDDIRPEDSIYSSYPPIIILYPLRVPVPLIHSHSLPLSFIISVIIPSPPKVFPPPEQRGSNPQIPHLGDSRDRRVSAIMGGHRGLQQEYGGYMVPDVPGLLQRLPLSLR